MHSQLAQKPVLKARGEVVAAGVRLASGEKHCHDLGFSFFWAKPKERENQKGIIKPLRVGGPCCPASPEAGHIYQNTTTPPRHILSISKISLRRGKLYEFTLSTG
ncbi:MAG: hypothetical protein ABJI77_09570 [Algoriphagus sp.]|uniref:hypothetical protein n=1 Tax=Algoriphagus sp. TaxID=1872435 RepID=UPI003299C04E